MKPLPIDAPSFPDLIERGMLYADKTAYVWDIVRRGKYYFLARPPRFGKTLLLTTMQAFFRGRRQLFEGLAIAEKVQEWPDHPVLLLDFSTINHVKGPAGMEADLRQQLDMLVENYQLSIPADQSFFDYFAAVIRHLAERYNSVVLLIDECDIPLVKYLDAADHFAENLDWLSHFYRQIESLDEYWRLLFLTGVTGYGKAPVFEGLKRLEDITLSPAFNHALGFNQQEIDTFFSDYLDTTADTIGLPVEQLNRKIRRWYHGYSWDGEEKVYNPFDVLSCLQEQELDSFWFDAGRTRGLIEWIKEQKHLPSEFEGVKVIDPSGGSMTPQHVPLYPLLFQTGYLSVYRQETHNGHYYYQLNYPNWEIKYNFSIHLLASFMEMGRLAVTNFIEELQRKLLAYEFEDFARDLRSFYIFGPEQPHLPRAAFFHSIGHLLLSSLGTRISRNDSPLKMGNIKGILESPKTVFFIVFNFAVNKNLRNVRTLSWNGLQQLHKERPQQHYKLAGRQVVLLGLGYLRGKTHAQYEIIENSRSKIESA